MAGNCRPSRLVIRSIKLVSNSAPATRRSARVNVYISSAFASIPPPCQCHPGVRLSGQRPGVRENRRTIPRGERRGADRTGRGRTRSRRRQVRASNSARRSKRCRAWHTVIHPDNGRHNGGGRPVADSPFPPVVGLERPALSKAVLRRCRGQAARRGSRSFCRFRLAVSGHPGRDHGRRVGHGQAYGAASSCW